MSTDSHNTNLNPLLRSVWQRQQTLHLGKGTLIFFRWAIPLFFIGMAADWLIRLPAPVRMVMVAALLIHSCRKAWQAGWNQMRSFNAVHTALRIEEEVGNMESLLVSAIQLSGTEAGTGVSAPMLEKTRQEAEDAGSGLQAGRIIRYSGLNAPLKAAIIPIAALVLFAIVNADFLGVGLGRIFPPWNSEAYPTRTQLDFAGEDMIIQEGEPAIIAATISGVIPREAKLELRTGTGRPRVHKLPILEGHCEYSVKSAFRSFEYRIKAGDARSDWRPVEVIPSPRIASAELSLVYPEYTDKPTETIDAMTVTVPEDTEINWSLKLDRAVSKAECEMTDGTRIPLEVSNGGMMVSMVQSAKVSQAYNFIWTEKDYDFTFVSPSHYLQVAPDQAPRVELTSPSENLYATLGRKLDLKYRGRDDHGIGEAYVTYRIDKVEETRVPFEVPADLDGSEQSIDWDYRTVLTNLAIGDNVSFAVELVDRYPGKDGAHRARSQSRRISFLSKEDYLAQIARQKKRLLLQLRSIYREERMVHTTIRDLEPTSDVFAQTCQLEAVRQDLMRERLSGLKQRMDVLLDDLAANNITNKEETATFVALSGDLQDIADNHIGLAATRLRELAESSTDATAGTLPDSSLAVSTIDHAARELAIQILQIGYKEATEVMARELHAIAESEAVVRLNTMLSTQKAEHDKLAASQDELGQWLDRLLNALPVGKESNEKEALVAFRLSRLSKELRLAGVNQKIADIITMIQKSETVKAPAVQAEVIATILKAEFKLRYGAEHDALIKAAELFAVQASAHKQLREEGSALSEAEYGKRKAEFTRTQSLLQKKLQLLLLPEIPAGRMSLFDETLPETPPVGKLLAAAEAAMKSSADNIGAGNGKNAAQNQQQAQDAFTALEAIVQTRIAQLTERTQMGAISSDRGNHAAELTLYIERQLGILEKTEDAADDSINAVYIAPLQTRLAEDLRKFHTKVSTSKNGASAHAMLLQLVKKSEEAMTQALPALKENKPGDAIDPQDTALTALEEAVAMSDTQNRSMAFFISALNADFVAQLPIPYVADIRDEQKDLLADLKKADDAEDRARLAVVQKNLVHSVNVILDTLEKMLHHVESGTTMLFAKEDMQAAAIGIEENDMIEAEDAGSFVAEQMHELYIDLKELAPQYRYIVEVTEYLNDAVSQNIDLQVRQRQLREALETAEEDAAKKEIAKQQSVLLKEARDAASLYHRASGQPALNAMADAAAAGESNMKSGKTDDAIDSMYELEDISAENNEAMLLLLENFSVVLGPPAEGSPIPPQVKLLWDVLELASKQLGLHRRVMASPAKNAKDFASEQLELAEKLNGYVAKAKAFTYNPSAEVPAPILLIDLNQSDEKLAEAHQQLLGAKDKLGAGAYDQALAHHQQADDALRHFIFDYVVKYVVPPGPAPPSDPVLSDAQDPPETDEMVLFMPGQISGAKPKGGRLEWQVLGRRDRAALNENFARELPLEYRAILKTYYERLAQ